ncbi:hypothetical protein [Flectobacillus rivi]|uniref:Uncharacterized protein n=1 Tax=Flectobacillus rivi TaxID=2984209 RepID=A0ABT6YYJ9_9BACT|nr:hypothetical protein [Flectobacillus rivi]MDI9873489.1 hypothetical protein [Flectobacillus rivi]
MKKHLTIFLSFFWGFPIARENFWRIGVGLLCMLCCLVNFSVWAQLDKVNEVEYIKDYGKTKDWSVIPLKEKGALVVLDNAEIFGRNSQWEFYRIDSTLKELWNAKYTPPVRMENLLTYSNADYMYFLFAEADADDFVITRVNLGLGEIDEFKGKLVGLRTISHFKVLGNSAYFAGTYFDKPVVISFAFFNSTTKVLSGIYDKNVTINTLEIDEIRNEVNVVINERRKGICSLSVLSYSYMGDLLRTNQVPLADHKNVNFVSGRLLPVSEQETILVGNFSTNCSNYSRGLYLTHFDNGEQTGTTMIDFSELSNFFGYLSPKRQQKLKEKIARKKNEGKETNFSYLLQVHDLIKTEKGALVLAEVYYFSPNNNNTLGVYNYAPISIAQVQRMRARAGRYRYTHAIVCEFTKDGKVLWDDAVSLGSLEGSGLVEQVQVSKYKGDWIATYLDKGKLNLQNLHNGKGSSDKELFEIKSDIENRRIDEEAEVAAWYDKYFLIWGTRQVPARSDNAIGSEVLYIRKMAYAPEQSSPTSQK